MLYHINVESAAEMFLEPDMADEPIFHIDATIELQPDEDADEDFEPEVVGRVEAYRILCELAQREGVNIAYLMDGEHADLGEAWRALRDADLDDFLGQDLLVIQTVDIEPEHRGKELALQAVRAVIRVHGGGCQFVVINALPSGYGDDPDEAAREKLERYFSRLGALKLPRPGFLLIELLEDNPQIENGIFPPAPETVEEFSVSRWMTDDL